ncbi:MAG: putative lipid II flippase FtsW [Actinobacteria bacterium]|nr:putative lipid II flippase FtsW [Actinomycetota bacterium]
MTVHKASQRKSLFAQPSSAYYLILGSVSILTALGLVMVLSASSVTSLNESGNSFAVVLRQGIFLALALPLAWLAMHLKETLWIPIARTSLVVSAGLLILPQIPGVGKTIGGNTNWIGIGSFTIQPSEFAKVGMILWCAMRLRIHDQRSSQGKFSSPISLIAPGVALLLFLVLLGKDLGTAVVFAAIVAGILFISGLPMRAFAAFGFILGIPFLILIINSSNRLNRFAAFFDPFSVENYKGVGWQQAHSIMGLASGGALGTGLGSSKQKWGNLPEAHTDFIFAVIGEELGLLGTLAVLILFGILILGIFRVALRAENSFESYASAGIGCWFAIQVLLNIGTVISVLPVVGVTLPFISYGGSSLLASFISIGFVLGVLRRDPVIAAEIAERKRSRSARG